jgi:glycosyltransferase involved in cell wall biosynthesis
MRFHVLALPHTVTTKEYLSCAYSQKVLKFCMMMKKLGHTVYHYGHEESQVECDEHITVTDNTVLQEAYGGYDWKKEFFRHSIDDHANREFERRAIPEVAKRKQPGDFLLCFWGSGHAEIAKAHSDMIIVEPGIGYGSSGSFAQFKVFESHAIANLQYAELKQTWPSWYHAIIPNYFDPEDFTYQEEKEDYFLYIGRIIKSKGVDIAVQVTEKIGAKLLIAGQGDFVKEMGYEPPAHVEMIGFADVETRKKLMAGAKCVLVPSYYNEPFGGVMVEALFSGTPIITTDWGGFAENNLHGVTGYRCRTMEQFVWAAKNIDKIKPLSCRQWAMNFSMDRVGKMYEEYFLSLGNVQSGKGWYEENPERTELDWLSQTYPDDILENC